MNKQQFRQLIAALEHTGNALLGKFGDALETQLEVRPGATDHEISAVEARIKRSIPEQMQALYRLSSHLYFYWFVDEDEAQEELPEIDGETVYTGGREIWTLDELPDIIEHYDFWKQQEHVAGWQDKFPVMLCDNGDVLALYPDGERLAFLCHEDLAYQYNSGEEQDLSKPSMSLDMTYPEFVMEWARLACPGPELFPLWRFYVGVHGSDLGWAWDGRAVLDADGEQAIAWRRQLGL